MGEHTLTVNVVQGNGDAYSNDEASASVTVTVVGVACESSTDCSDEDPCTLDACEGELVRTTHPPLKVAIPDWKTSSARRMATAQSLLTGWGLAHGVLCPPR